MVAAFPDEGGLARAARSVALKARPLALTGSVQAYDWGGFTFIADLLGQTPAPGRPAAELWLGAHPAAPASVLVEGEATPLDALVARVPAAIAGEALARRFGGTLPYLLKILDVREALSIQAHPQRAQARAGFEREQAASIPLDAPERAYRDANHKPEMQVALTDFWLLHGFRPLEAIARTLDDVPELRPLLPSLGDAPGPDDGPLADAPTRLRLAYSRLMTRPQGDVDQALSALMARLEPRYAAGDLDRGTPHFWAAKAAAYLPLVGGGYDRGLVSIYLLNLLHLQPGQATFVGAGVLHASLHGIAVEIMANSDNVLRGGLTKKPVHVPELVRILDFHSGPPTFVEPERLSSSELVYRPPAEEFELSRIRALAGQPHYGGPVHGADTLVVLEGAGRVRAGDETLLLRRGSAVLVPHGVVYAVDTDDEMVLFKAAVPAGGGSARSGTSQASPSREGFA